VTANAAKIKVVYSNKIMYNVDTMTKVVTSALIYEGEIDDEYAKYDPSMYGTIDSGEVLDCSCFLPADRIDGAGCSGCE
jgi:hypothetical protein